MIDREKTSPTGRGGQNRESEQATTVVEERATCKRMRQTEHCTRQEIQARANMAIENSRAASREVPSRRDRSDGGRTLRPSQLKPFEDLQGQDHFILNSPTGWGKTTLLSFLAADRLRRDLSAKVVIIVPQQIISRGFVTRTTLNFPDGDKAEWNPIDLCDTTPAKVDRMVNFLTLAASGPRVVVTTHAGFVAAFSRIGKQKRRAFRNVIVVVDESHHIQAGDADVQNQLGGTVSRLIELNVPLWLATAYFFRGDKAAILQDAQLAKFRRIFIPLDEHLASMKYTKTYFYDFVAYKQSVFPEMESLFRESHAPTLIYCPPAGHGVLGNLTKEEFVDRIVQTIRRHYPGATEWRPGCPHLSNVILDLSSTSDRMEKTKFIQVRGDDLAAILTVGMFREGADWPACSRVIDLVPSASDQERNQKFGRLIRDHPGKETVRYYSFLPLILGRGDEKHRIDYSRLFAHFHASLIFDNALNPIKVPSRTTGARDGEVGGQGPKDDILGRFSQDRQHEIEAAVSDSLVAAAAAEEERGRELTSEKVSRCILGTLKRLKCDAEIGDDLEALRDQIILLWRRRRNPTLDVGDLLEQGFDKVWSCGALEPIKIFSAGHCGTATFAELRELLSVGGLVEAERWARECSVRYSPGQLPSLKAKTPEGRRDAQKITALRMSRRGIGRSTWYPSVEAIFDEAGHVGAFDSTDHQAEAEQWARGCASRYEPGHLPSWRSSIPMEAHDGKRLERMRSASRGRHGRAKYYPTVGTIFASAGHVGVFGPATNHRARAEEWAHRCASRYAPGHLPKLKGDTCEMRRDAQKIHNMRAARRGQTRGRYYPTVDAIFSAAGHFCVFD